MNRDGQLGRRWRLYIGLFLLVACREAETGGTISSGVSVPPAEPSVQSTPVPTRTKELSCSRAPFATAANVPEASGTAWLPSQRRLLVVGDSGTNGAFVLLDAETGETKGVGRLPLDSNASDDLEGLAYTDGVLYGLTSSGWMRHWNVQLDGDQVTAKLTEESYSIAPEQFADEYQCQSPHDTNCAKNYEGLCLLRSLPERGTDVCVGFAASKATGQLVCLQMRDGRLVLNPETKLPVAGPKQLTGCSFDGEGNLWFGTNTFGGNTVGIVQNWQTPTEKIQTRRARFVGVGFIEAIAAAENGEIFRFSDTTSAPSLLSKYICR